MRPPPPTTQAGTALEGHWEPLPVTVAFGYGLIASGRTAHEAIERWSEMLDRAHSEV